MEGRKAKVNKTLICILCCAVCWAAVLGIAFGLMCAAAAVPQEKLSENLISSCDKLAVHDPHEKTLEGQYSSICDNYADAVLLGVAANISSEDIPRSVIDTKYFDDDYGPAVGIRATLSGKEANVDYTRYWHGSLVFVRPLLALTDIDGIRLIGTAVIVLLLAGNIFLLLRGKHTAAAVIFAVSACLVHIWFVFTTLEYMTVFIIMLLALPLYVRFTDNLPVLAVISVGVGTLTAFADFLTAETLTILVPLTVSFFVTAENGEKPDGKKSLAKVISCGAAWGAGYLLTFAAKWLIASAALGRDISDAAVTAAEKRLFGMEGDITSPLEMFVSSLGANFSALAPVPEKISAVGAIVWIAVFAAVCAVIYRLDKRKHNLPKAAVITIAAVPVVRFMVLMNHSFMHSFFTYRALMPSIMAVIGLMWYRVGGNTPQKKPRKK